jgi:hypothetical protein
MREEEGRDAASVDYSLSCTLVRVNSTNMSEEDILTRLVSNLVKTTAVNAHLGLVGPAVDIEGVPSRVYPLVYLDASGHAPSQARVHAFQTQLARAITEEISNFNLPANTRLAKVEMNRRQNDTIDSAVFPSIVVPADGTLAMATPTSRPCATLVALAAYATALCMLVYVIIIMLDHPFRDRI